VNSILVDEQYGFRPSRSATTNLIVFHNFILEAIEKRTQVDVIFTDFSKAFDRVDHKILIEVLYKAGFGEPILSWFKSYLSDRVQYVKVLGCKSEAVCVPSGVPQGGHLSPLLFSLLVNCLKQVIPDSMFLMLADDLKIFRLIESVTDCVTLQKELDALVLWFNSMGLSFNVGKCQSMSFARSRNIIHYTYLINGSFFCHNLDFHYHIEAVCCRVLKMLGFVIRTSKEFRLSSSLKALYCSLVRPLLEYSSILWDPFTAADSSCIERVQRRFCSLASFILQIPHPPHDYWPVMNKL
jgi:hypothetical protein